MSDGSVSPLLGFEDEQLVKGGVYRHTHSIFTLGGRFFIVMYVGGRFLIWAGKGTAKLVKPADGYLYPLVDDWVGADSAIQAKALVYHFVRHGTFKPVEEPVG